MRIEVYQDSNLIEVEESLDVVQSLPNVSAFITSMMSNNNYNLVVSSTNNRLARNRLEIAIVRLELKTEITIEDLQLFKTLWDSVMNGKPESIVVTNEEWNAIAESCYMPFRFDADLKMLLIPNP